jgi:hypothetical protein
MSSRRTKVIVIAVAVVIIVVIGFAMIGIKSVESPVTWTTNKPNPKLTRNDILNPLHELVASIKIRDKEKYLSLFSKNAVIEDPLGIEPFKNTEKGVNSGISVFWETNFTPNEITFVSREDIICGLDVFRDADVTISPEPGVELKVKSYSLYQMIEEDGKVKIDHLKAFWESDLMGKQMMSYGFKSAGIAMKFMWSIIKNQGFAGMMGFMKSSIGIKEKGKETVAAFVEAVNNRMSDKLIPLFNDKTSVIELNGSGIKYDVQGFIEKQMKTSQLAVDDLRSASWFTACRYNLDDNGKKTHGIAVFQFNPENKKLTAVRFYWNK